MAKQHNESKSVWIVVIILAFLFLMFVTSLASIAYVVKTDSGEYTKIGFVQINDTIVSSTKTIQALYQFENDDSVKAILIRIDSPGGAVAASQEIREAIKTLKKKSVISLGNTAASGALYIACSGPKIYANPGTITGSIGVISQIVQINDLMEFLKFKVNTVKTGMYKDAGSPFREFTPEDQQLFSDLGNELYTQFVDDIVETRKIEKNKLLKIADGRVFSGREAKNYGIIDELGGLDAAIKGLKKTAGITGEIKLIPPETPTDEILNMLLNSGADAFINKLQSLQKTNTYQYLYKP